jgi:hypothetical protein
MKQFIILSETDEPSKRKDRKENIFKTKWLSQARIENRDFIKISEETISHFKDLANIKKSLV